MDPFGAFKSEVFRPIASIVLPGFLALGPFVIVTCNASEAVQTFFDRHETAAYLLLLGAATVFGMLLECIGASIERGIDECMEKEYLKGVDEIWDRYLSEKGVETNARRFLGTLVTRLKFINSLIPAVVISSIGMFWLHLQVQSLTHWQVAAFAVLILTVLFWLFRFSIELSEAATFSRYRLLASVGKAVRSYNPKADTVGRHRHLAYVLVEVLTSRVNQLEIKDKNWLYAFWWIIKTSKVLLVTAVTIAFLVALVVWFAA